MGIFRACIVFLLCSAAGAPCMAADYGCGSVFPAAKTLVRLDAEEVTLQLGSGEGEADATYRLTNPGGATSLELSLPFRAGVKAALGIGEDQPDSIRNLELEAEGNELEATVGPHDRRGGMAAFLWALKLEPEATVQLKIGYDFDMKPDENGISHLDYAWGNNAAWGATGSAKLSIDLGRPFPACYLSVSPAPQTWESSHLQWSLAPAQATIVSVSLDERRGDIFSVLERKALLIPKLGVDEALMLKHTVFALRGKVFPPSALQRHFQAQDWYKPRQDYSDKLLSKQEWKVVAALDRRLARARGQKVPKH